MKSKLIFTFLLLLGVSVSYAQVQERTQVNTDTQAKLVKTKKLQNGPGQNNVKLVDEYMGKKEKILKILKTDYIPSDFPKYVIGSNRENYRNTVKTWLKNHLDLVKEKHRAKISSL